MSKEEEKLLTAMAEELPEMPDYERGRIIGYSEAIINARKKREEEEKKEEQANVSNGKRNNNDRTATAEP